MNPIIQTSSLYLPEAFQFYRRTGTRPNHYQIKCLNTLIKTFKTAGLWDNIVVFSPASLINGGLTNNEAVGNTYTSNFSGGVDSWAGTNITLSGNETPPAPNNSESGWLKAYANATDSSHRFSRTASTAGIWYRVLARTVVPAGQTNVNGVEWRMGGNTAALLPIPVTSYSTTEEISHDFYYISDSTAIARVFMAKSAIISFAGANSSSDDRVYVKGVKYTKQTQYPATVPFFRGSVISTATPSGICIDGSPWSIPGMYNANTAYSGYMPWPLTGVTLQHNPGFTILKTITPATLTALKYYISMYKTGGTDSDANGFYARLKTADSTKIQYLRNVGANPLSGEFTHGMTAGTNYVLACVFNNGDFTFYINGVSKSTETYDDLNDMTPDWLLSGVNYADTLANRSSTVYKNVAVLSTALTEAQVILLSNALLANI